MKLTRDMTYLNVCLGFAVLTATLLLAVGFIGDTSRIYQILVILSGMTAMGSFTSLQRYLEHKGVTSNLPINFNEEFLSISVSEAFHEITDDKLLKERGQYENSLPWNLTGDQLVGKDNALALAKMKN